MKQWVIVSSKIGSRFYEYSGTGKGLHLLKTLENPEGKLHNRDFYSDNPGHSTSHGSGTHNMTTEQDKKDRVVQDFAEIVAKDLNHSRNEGGFEKLFLIAEPGFMGTLLSHLDDHTAALVEHRLNKDLYAMKDEEILHAMNE
jgi:protein required for attachment to host cells